MKAETIDSNSNEVEKPRSGFVRDLIERGTAAGILPGPPTVEFLED